MPITEGKDHLNKAKFSNAVLEEVAPRLLSNLRGAGRATYNFHPPAHQNLWSTERL